MAAEEKFKDLADGSRNRYVYYSCTKFYDKKCKNKYLREDSLISQLTEIIQKIDLDKIGIKKKLEQELERMNKFRGNVLGLSSEEIETQKKADIRSYAKYVLTEGTLEEKRELMQSFKSKITMIDKKIILDHS